MTAAALLIAPSVAMAATGTTSSSAPTPSYMSQFGSLGTGDGQFYNPEALAIAGNGNIYVADKGNSRVEQFTGNGTYVSQFSTPSSQALAIAGNGNVYVTDNLNSHIEEFTSSGTYMSQFGSLGTGDGQFYNPEALAIAGNGNIYVLDTLSDRVEEFTSSGTYMSQFGTYGTGDGQFSSPIGVAIASNGNVYVIDGSNSRIEEFTSSGTYVSQFGTYGDGDGQFDYPMGIAIASNGNVYVADTNNNRIEEFSSSGDYIAQFGTYGTGNGQLNYPMGIAIASNGNVYVADKNNGRVEVFGYPQNLGTVTSATGSSQINLTLPDTDDISSITSSTASATDSGYNYPLGLVNFTSSVASGSTTPVTLTFQTDLKPSEVTARKYNPATKQYAAIPNATITETTSAGKPALQITYNVTDGGSLDQDGTANGTIVDPVGLATAAGTNATTTAKAPDTGYGTPHRSSSLALAIGTAAIVSTTGGLALLYRQKRLRNSQNS